MHLINSLGAGGAERSLVEMLPVLARHGIASTVVTLKPATEGFEQAARAAGTRVDRLPGSSMVSWAPAFRRWVRRHQPRLVHTSLFEADLVGRLAAAGTGIPVLTSLVSLSYDASRRTDPHLNQVAFRAVKLIDRTTARHLTTHFHAVSYAVKAWYEAHFRLDGNAITVIERGRSRALLGYRSELRRVATRQRLALPKEVPVLLCVGRHEYAKGHRFLLAAMQDLVRVIPAITLLLAGKAGAESGALEAMTVEAGLTERVRFLGHRDDVPDLMTAADLLILPSRFEGFPGVMVEAMGLGLPIVASDLPMVREAAGEYGVYVPAGDSARLSDAIVELVGDPARRQELARGGLARFEERFDVSGVGGRMAALIRRVIAGETR